MSEKPLPAGGAGRSTPAPQKGTHCEPKRWITGSPPRWGRAPPQGHRCPPGTHMPPPSALRLPAPPEHSLLHLPRPMTSVAAPRPPPTPTPWPCNQPLPGLQVIRPRAGAEKKRMGLQGIASAERCWHVSIATWGKYFMQKSICCSIKGVPANNRVIASYIN